MATRKKRLSYTRDKIGQFSKVPGSGSGSSKGKLARQGARPARSAGPSVHGKARSQRSVAAQIVSERGGVQKKGAIGKVSNKAIRRERNQQAIDALRALGNKIPKGSIKKAGQLRKGESVKLANGTVLKRSENNTYSIVKPRKRARVSGGMT